MALFGLKYYGELRSKHQGIIWRVEIAQRGYVGDCEEMTFCGSDPIKVTWEKRDDDFYVPVKAREVTWHGWMPLLVEVSLQCLAQLIFTPFVLYGLMDIEKDFIDVLGLEKNLHMVREAQ